MQLVIYPGYVWTYVPIRIVCRICKKRFATSKGGVRHQNKRCLSCQRKELGMEPRP